MYFLVAHSVVDRDDLTVYEKMACVVLARYANQQAFENLLSIESIAHKMGVVPELASRALDGLKLKGLLATEDAPPSNVHKQLKNLKLIEFEPLEEVKEGSETIVSDAAPAASDASLATKDAVQATSDPVPASSDTVIAIFDEVISKRQALILYELSGRRLSYLKSSYELVRSQNPFDVIDALSHYLQQPNEVQETPSGQTKQKPDELPTQAQIEDLFSALGSVGEVSGREVSGQEVSGQEAGAQEAPIIKTQVNMSRIHALYQNQTKKNKK